MSRTTDQLKASLDCMAEISDMQKDHPELSLDEILEILAERKMQEIEK